VPVDHTSRLTLEQVTTQLVHWFDSAGDFPVEHECAPTTTVVDFPARTSLGYDVALGYSWPAAAAVVAVACDHSALGAPLLERLAELVEPGSSGPKSSPGKSSGKGPKGSPAPWAAAPAELLDEALRGAIELHDTARAVLGLTPEDYAGTDVAARGRIALDRLDSDVRMLQERRPEHWLASSPCPGGPACTIGREHLHPGAIETRARSWRKRALQLTGHETPRAKVRQVLNLDHPDHTDRPVLGPVHPARGPHLCLDDSCLTLRHARANRYQVARCPFCDSVSLEQDPDSGHVECVRPSCRDDEGQRRMWTIDELATMGLVIAFAEASR
jgi:hypothetical protein